MSDFEIWQEGVLLSDAAIKAQSNCPVSQVPIAAQASKISNDNLNSASLSASLMALVDAMQVAGAAMYAPKDAILRKLSAGKLTAFGFAAPRRVESPPQRIPRDVFLSPKVNWENSSIQGAGLAFVSVRVVTTIRASVRKGRPSRRAQIRNAIGALLSEGALSETLSRKVQVNLVRQRVKAQNSIATDHGLSDETIRPLLNDELAKRSRAERRQKTLV